MLPPDIRANFSGFEQECAGVDVYCALLRLMGCSVRYFAGYTRGLNAYMEDVGLDDLTAGRQPPKELYIEVRCLVDVGEIATEEGCDRPAAPPGARRG